jgi:carbon monoxide dehydrogenase subunit G
VRIVKEDVINAPPEKVFDFVSDPERRPLFIPNLAGISRISPAQREVGQSWDYHFSLLGVTLNGTGRCTDYEANRRYALRTEGAVSSTWVYTLTPEGKGTRLQVEIEYDPPPSVLAQVANTALLSRMNENDAARGMQNLKIILED